MGPGRGGSRRVESLQGAAVSCAWKCLPVLLPRVFLPVSQGTNIKGNHGRNSTCFIFAPSGCLTHGAHNIWHKRTKLRLREGKGIAKVTKPRVGET